MTSPAAWKRSTFPSTEVAKGWAQLAKQLKAEIYALYLAYRDPRTPWYARVIAGLVVAYALSPLDLVPDPVPLLGHLDDAVIIPLGVVLALKLVPPQVLADARNHAQASVPAGLGRRGLVLVLFVWAVVVGAGLVFVLRLLGTR